MIVQIFSLIIVGLIVAYYLRKEQVKHDSYFGKSRKYNKKELAILDFHKNIYTPIPKDKRFFNFKRDKIELEDIALTATQIVFDNPIPTKEEILRVKNGDMVKLLFSGEEGYVERMWVEVLEVDNLVFKGILRNDAIDFNKLSEGKTIYFHSNNVFEIDYQA